MFILFVRADDIFLISQGGPKGQVCFQNDFDLFWEGAIRPVILAEVQYCALSGCSLLDYTEDTNMNWNTCMKGPFELFSNTRSVFKSSTLF